MTVDRPFADLWWFRRYVTSRAGMLLFALAITYVSADLRGTGIRLLGEITTALTSREGGVAAAHVGSVSGRLIAALQWTAGTHRGALLTIVAALLVAASTITLGRDIVRMRVAAAAKRDMRADLLGALAQETAAERRQRGAGASVEMYRADVDVVATHLSFGAAGVLENALQLAVYALLLLQAIGGSGGWKLLGAFLLLSIVGQAFATRVAAAKERRALTEVHEAQRRLMSVTTRFFDVFRELTFLGSNARVGSRLTDDWAGIDRASQRIRVWTGVGAIVSEAAQQLTLPIILLAVAASTPGDVGNVLGATLLFAQMAGPLAALLAYPRALRQVVPSLRHLRPILDSPREDGASAPAVASLAARPVAASIRLSGIRARFPGASHDVLRDVNIVIPAGARVAIVGESGGGKTTLARVISGDQPIEAGSAWIDDVDVTAWPVVARRAVVAFVPSPPGFLLDTIRANVEFGRDVADNVFDAAIRASATDGAAAAQPGGLSTVMTPETSLSVGEQRRIALARGLCSPQRVLILDEPTAQLDAATLRRVAHQLLDLTVGRTCIFVTNDPELAAVCDQAFLVENGEVRAVAPDFARRWVDDRGPRSATASAV